jgi:hypothetical protein
MVTIPQRADQAGIPRQYDDVVTGIWVALITGDEPEVVTRDMTVAANQTILARTVVGLDANGNIVPASSTVEAANDLTMTAAPTAGETVVIGGQTYTFRAAPTTVANEVKIGASTAESVANLIAAINGADGAGTLYGSLTNANADVIASAGAAGVVHVVDKQGGTAPNSIATTETGANMAWATTTLTGGTALPTTRAIGITVCDVTTGPSGALKGAPIYRAGVFNPLALIWGASYSSEAEKINAFEGAPSPTNIIMRRPKTATVAGGPSDFIQSY